MSVIQKSIITTLTTLTILAATEEHLPNCRKANNNHVTCTVGYHNYILTRGLVSDDNTTTSISLSSCGITDILDDAFSELPSLESIDLSLNNITTLRVGVLNETIHLIYLNLSFNLISEIPLGFFDQTILLKVLDLKGNNINKIKLGVFDSLHQLSFVDLSENDIAGKNLCPYLFFQTPHLLFLNLRKNNLFEIHVRLFLAFESLEVINLDKTMLQKVPMFTANLKTVKYLILSGNRITELNNVMAFVHLISLEQLDLSYNIIDHISGSIFSPLKNLRKVVLKNNRLKNIPDDLFQYMPKLTTVNLSGNKISVIPVNLFNGTPIKYLDLSSNELTYLADHYCLKLWNTGGLLKTFYFDSNPWQCACLNDLLKEIKYLGIKYNSEKYKGNDPVCVTNNEFVCKRHRTFNYLFYGLYYDVIPIQ